MYGLGQSALYGEVSQFLTSFAADQTLRNKQRSVPQEMTDLGLDMLFTNPCLKTKTNIKVLCKVSSHTVDGGTQEEEVYANLDKLLCIRISEC